MPLKFKKEFRELLKKKKGLTDEQIDAGEKSSSGDLAFKNGQVGFILSIPCRGGELVGFLPAEVFEDGELTELVTKISI